MSLPIPCAPRSRSARRCGVFLLAACALRAPAQEYWTNLTTGTHNLSAAANWEDGNTLTSGATDLRFFINSLGTDQLLGGAYTINNDLTGLALARLDLNGNATAAGRSVTLNGNAFTLSAGATLNLLNDASSGGNSFGYTVGAPVTVGGDLTVAGSPSNPGSITFNSVTLPGTAATFTTTGSGRVALNNATLSANHVFTGAGTGGITLGGTVTLAGSRTLDVSGASTIALGGTVTDGGGGFSVTKTGNGLLTLAAANHTLGGGVNLQAGTLGLLLGAGSVNHTAGGVTVSSGATLRYDWTGTPTNPGSSTAAAFPTGSATLEYGSANGNPVTATLSGNHTGAAVLAVTTRTNKDSISFTGDNKDYAGPVTITSASPFSSVNPSAVYFASANARFGSANAAVVGVKNGGRVGFTGNTVAADLTPFAFGNLGGVVLSGASGALDAALTNPYSTLGGMPGASIVLDNRSNLNANRLGDTATIALNSGSLVVFGRNANTSPVNESVGAITLAGGSRVTLDLQNTNNSGVLLTASSLETPGAGESLLFDEADTTSLWGTAANNSRLVVTGTKPAVVNGMVAPSIQYYSGSNILGEYLTFSGNDLVKATYFTGFDGGSSTEIAHLSTATTLAAPETVHALRVSSGTLNLGNQTLTVGSGGVIMNSLTIGTGTLNLGSLGGVIGAYNAAAQATLSANITVSGGLVFTGATQTLNVTGTGNSISGGIFINGGSVRLAGTAANGNDVTVNAFGRLVAGPASSGTDTIGGLSGGGQVSAWVAGAGSSTGILNIAAPSGSYTFTGQLTNGSTGRTLALTKSNGATQTLTGDSTYTGVTTVSGGVLALSSVANGGLASPIGASTSAAANLVIGNATLRYTGPTASTDRSFTVNAGATGAIDVSSAATTLTLSGSTAATTGALAKDGLGTLVLSGANAHTGATLVRAGTLRTGSTGAIPNEGLVEFAPGATTATLDLNGIDRRLGRIDASGTTTNARIDNTSASPATLTLRSITGTSVFDGQIHNSGGGALTVEVGYVNASPNAVGLTLGGSGGSTFTGPLRVQPNGTLTVTSGQESSLGAATGADALTLNGGTLRVTTADLVLNDTGRGVLVDGGNFGSHSGGTFSVAGGRSLTFANTVDASGVTLRKTDTGTLNLPGTTLASSLVLFGGLTDIEGGTLRVNALTLAGGTFNWGTGRIAHLSADGASGSTDYSSIGGQTVSVGTTATVTAAGIATDPGSVLQAHGSPTFYLNNGVRFNQYVFSGLLDLSAAGDTLEVQVNPALLRPTDASFEYGSVPLVVAGQITSVFDTFGTVTDDGKGFTQFTGGFTSAAALPNNTWYLQYADTNNDTLSDTIFFHFRLTGGVGVPEPSTLPLLAVGAYALRLLRRSKGV